MKKKSIIIIIFSINLIFSQGLNAQTSRDSCCLSKAEIIGTWQRDNSIVGSGLGQNFIFFKNKSFVLNIGNDADDVRDIIQLKGTYRLINNMIYFTINVKEVIEGPIEISDPGISLNIFNIGGTNVKEMPENNPKELPDPCYITFFNKNHIKIDEEQYYKIKP